jgi:hypothetical protein
MRRASLLVALLALGACHHVPPNPEARAAPRPAAKARVPTAAELHGPWTSGAVRGALADIGTFALYVFGPDGRYSGALANETTSTPLEGTYAYADGTLTFDDGTLEMTARLVGDRLELTSEDAFLVMVRPGRP